MRAPSLQHLRSSKEHALDNDTTAAQTPRFDRFKVADHTACWSLIVIRDLMFGNRRHFRELLTRSEERIASNILANWLTRLERAGLVSRRDDPSHKQKVIYSLTEASIALVPLLAHMGGWGLRPHTRVERALRTREDP